MLPAHSDAQRASPLGAHLLPWLLHLRSAVIVVLSGSLVASRTTLGLDVNFAIALPVIAAMAASVVLQRRLSDPARAPQAVLFANVAFDIAAIAGVLAASGGAANPFSAILMVYVALAASLFPLRTTLALSAFAALTFGALFLVPMGPGCHMPVHEEAFNSHLYGMWAAFALGAVLVTVFLTRMRAAMREKDEELERLRLREEQADRFRALGTLAAGTAHELGTPLGTIFIAAGELAESDLPPDEVRARARMIADQVTRCRAVLTRMRSRDTGHSAGLADLATSVPSAVASWQRANPEANVLVRTLASSPVSLSQADLDAALAVLLDNALAASKAGGRGDAPIVVEVGQEGRAGWLSVTDVGVGLEEEAQRRVGEPFFSTKPEGEGMGLGLYVVRTLLEPFGGGLDVESHAPSGTRVRLRFGPVLEPA